MSLPKDEKKGALPVPDDEGNERNYKYDPKPNGNGAGKKILGATIMLIIVLGGSVLVANFIWDSAHDTSGDSNKVTIQSLDCVKTGTGSIKGEAKITNKNDYGVIVEWVMNGDTGYAKLSANTFMIDQVYSYRTASNCAFDITSVTRVP